MGLFDKILKTFNMDSAAELVDKVGKVINNDTNNSSQTYSYTTNSSSPNVTSKSTTYHQPKIDHKYKAAYNNLEQKLEQIFATEYGEFTVRKEVSPSEFANQPNARNFSYVLLDYSGKPRAFIMLMRNRNDYRRKDVLLAKEAAENIFIPYMNFMPHLPNEISYISNRLRQNIFG